MLHVENICMIRDVHGILFLCICHYFATILPQNMIDVPEKYDLVFFWIGNNTPLCNSTK